MICGYCKSEIDGEALICPHCRQRTPIGHSKGAEKLFARLFVGVLAVGLLIGGATLLNPPKPLTERIKIACGKQFPGSIGRQYDCQVALAASAAERDSQARLNEAARVAGIR